MVGNLYAEDPLGLYVVRGENVVLLGDIDGADDPPAVLQKVKLCVTSMIPFQYQWDLQLKGLVHALLSHAMRSSLQWDCIGSLVRCRHISACCHLQVSIQDIRQAQRAEKEQEKIKKSMKARMDFLDFE